MNIKEHGISYTVNGRQIADINRETRILLKYIEMIQSKDPENKHIVDIYVPIEPFNYRLKEGIMKTAEKLDQIIQEEYKNMNGMLVVQKGNVVFENYYNGYSPDNAFHVASVTKR